MPEFYNDSFCPDRGYDKDNGHGKDCHDNRGREVCPVVGYQSVSVSVPVDVKPFARTGKVRTVCCCDPIVTMGQTHCEGKKDGTCHFTISQMICIEVPVNFGAAVAVGDTFVDCMGASSEAFPCEHCKKDDCDCDCDCDKEYFG